MTIHITPMPSPMHTNRAGLFVGTLGGPAARFAADSARRRHANDAAISDALSALQQFLNQKLTSPDDQRQAETLVTALLNAAPDDTAEDDETAPEIQRKDPNAFINRTEDRRRKMAGDRSVSNFPKRFPLARMPRGV